VHDGDFLLGDPLGNVRPSELRLGNFRFGYVKISNLCPTGSHLGSLHLGNLGRRQLGHDRDRQRSGIRVQSWTSSPGITQQPGDLADQVCFLTPSRSVVIQQGGSRSLDVTPMTTFSGSGCANAVQGIGELIPGLVDVGQPLQTFGQDGVHAVALSAFHRISEQCQRRLVAAFSEMHLGSQCQPQPADRAGSGSPHRTPQQRAHLMQRGLTRASDEQAERQLKH
jgi:hypothetical protein